MGNENFKPLTDQELDMFVQATHLEKEMINTNHEIFNSLTSDGKLTPELSLEILNAFLPGKNFNSLVKLIFEAFDNDKNGHIDFKEFLTGLAMFEANDEDKSFTKFLFKMADKDLSNGIDRKEFKPLIMFYVETINDSNQIQTSEDQKAEIDNQIECAFEAYDSGKKGFLNENEFANAFAAISKLKF